MAKDEAKNPLEKIVIIGNDDKYYDGFLEKLKSVSKLKPKVLRIDPGPEKLPWKISYEITKFKPDAIIMDFSKAEAELLKLSLFISKSYPIRDACLVGLLTGLKEYQGLKDDFIYSGLNFISYKLLEFDAVVAMLLLGVNFQNTKFEKYYVNKTEDKKVDISIPMKIGSISKNKLIVESNIEVPNLGDVLEIDVEFISKKVKAVCKKRTYENRYYNFTYKYELGFTLEAQEKLKELTLKEKMFKGLYESEALEQEQKFHKNLDLLAREIQEHADHKEKSLKCLIVDDNVTPLFEAKTLLDNHSFSVRLHQCLGEDDNILKEVDPSLVVYCLRDPIKGQTHLELITNFCKTSNKSPYVIIFDQQKAFINKNLDPETGNKLEEISNEISYEKVIVKENEFSYARITEILDSYGDKILEVIDEEDEKSVYLPKRLSKSNASFKTSWKVRYICENFLVFSGAPSVSLNSIVNADIDGVKVILTVVECPSSYERYIENKDEDHFAVISGVNELALNDLRTVIQKKNKKK